MKIIDERGKVVHRAERWCPGHDRVIDEILINPKIKTRELAEKTGYSADWVGRLKNSPIFEQRLRIRINEALTPRQRKDIKKKMQAVMIQGAEALQRKMDRDDSELIAARALEAAASTLQSLKVPL